MNKVVVITGMHRSGTSMVANTLYDLGVYMDEKSLLPADPSNSKGYFEDQDIINFHNDLLLENGRYPFLSKGIKSFRISSKLEYRADKIIEKYSKEKVWGFKDPRTSLFLDYWNRKLSGFELHYLFLYRDPFQVVDSLLRRNPDFFSGREKLTIQSWLIYNKSICRFAEKKKSHLLINIQNFIENPQEYLFQIDKKFGLDLSNSYNHAFEESLFKQETNSSLPFKQNFLETIQVRQCLSELQKKS